MNEEFTAQERAEDVVLEEEIKTVFIIGVTLKAIGAGIETILGLLLMYTHVVSNVLTFLLDWALVQDPDNFFFGHLQSFASLSPRTLFLGGAYLASHGFVKCVLMVALLRNKVWAYPASIAVLVLFMLYELVRFIQTFSVPTLLLLFFDALIVWLIYHEYTLMRRAQ